MSDQTPETPEREPIDDREKSLRERAIKLGLDSGIAIEVAPRKINEMVTQSEKVLHLIGLKYFERNREMVRTVFARDVKKDSDPYDRDESSVIIDLASGEDIILDLDPRVRYYSLTEDGKTKTLQVPGQLYKLIRNRVAKEARSIPFPTLDMVTPAPVLLPSGAATETIFSEGVLFVPQKRDLYKPVPENPTKEDAIAAMKLFAEVFQGFPFVDPYSDAEPLATASYSVVLSAVLTLIARPYLRFGPTPLHGFTAHMQRSGKSKLAKAATAAALGHTPTMIHYRDEEEFSKHLLPLMRASDRAIAIDNIEHPLESSKLCTLLTECVLRDRVLGESLDLTLRNTSVFFVTGNNLMIAGDLSVRAIRCDIDAQMERPEERKFDFDPVQQALDLHPELNRAALTALRAFILAGKPWELKRELYGGFESWDSLISGCLVWLGFRDPYETRSRVVADDPNREADLTLLEALEVDFGYEPFTVAEIGNRELRSAAYKILLKHGIFEAKGVGWKLKRLAGRIAGGLQLLKAIDPDGRTGNYGQYWKIKRLTGKKPGPVAEGQTMEGLLTEADKEEAKARREGKV